MFKEAVPGVAGNSNCLTVEIKGIDVRQFFHHELSTKSERSDISYRIDMRKSHIHSPPIVAGVLTQLV